MANITPRKYLDIYTTTLSVDAICGDGTGRTKVNNASTLLTTWPIITVLVSESEIERKHLREPRPRLKTVASCLEDSPTHSLVEGMK